MNSPEARNQTKFELYWSEDQTTCRATLVQISSIEMMQPTGFRAKDGQHVVTEEAPIGSMEDSPVDCDHLTKV